MYFEISLKNFNHQPYILELSLLLYVQTIIKISKLKTVFESKHTLSPTLLF